MIDRGEFGNIYMIRFRRVTSRDDAVAKWLNMPHFGGGVLHDSAHSGKENVLSEFAPHFSAHSEFDPEAQ